MHNFTCSGQVIARYNKEDHNNNNNNSNSNNNNNNSNSNNNNNNSHNHNHNHNRQILHKLCENSLMMTWQVIFQQGGLR